MILTFTLVDFYFFTIDMQLIFFSCALNIPLFFSFLDVLYIAKSCCRKKEDNDKLCFLGVCNDLVQK